MRTNEITRAIVNAAIEVQRTLGGPGLLESLYEEALAAELRLCGLQVERQLPIRVVYKGQALVNHVRLDLLVEGEVLVEVKSVPKLHPIFLNQALTYLRVSRKRIALVINFGEIPLRQGIRRVVNGLAQTTPAQSTLPAPPTDAGTIPSPYRGVGAAAPLRVLSMEATARPSLE